MILTVHSCTPLQIVCVAGKRKQSVSNGHPYLHYIHITFCVSAARPTVPVANRTQENNEPPAKISADQPRVGRRRSRRKHNKPIPDQRTGRDRSKRWLYSSYFSNYFCNYNKAKIQNKKIKEYCWIEHEPC